MYKTQILEFINKKNCAMINMKIFYKIFSFYLSKDGFKNYIILNFIMN